jgi:preprotein translocase subunit SecA
MFSWILQKIAGDYNQRILASLYPLVDKINQFDREWMSYSDEAIKQKT